MAKLLPVSIRLWAAFCHFTVIAWVPLLRPAYKLIPSGVMGCAVKPLEGCNNVPVFTILLFASLILPCLPFLSILLTLVIWKFKKSASTFIYEHGKEAIKFQFTSALFVWVIHIFVMLFSLWTRTFGHLLIMVVIDFFLFHVMAALQLLAATVAFVQAIRGNCIRYPLSLR